jgi:hypothetical protein
MDNPKEAMSTSNLGAKRYAFGASVEQQTTRQRKVIRTTVGELIVAVTDEVMPFVPETSAYAPIAMVFIAEKKQRPSTPIWR